MEKAEIKINEKNIWLAFSPIKQNPLNFDSKRNRIRSAKIYSNTYQKEQL